jgi:transposase
MMSMFMIVELILSIFLERTTNKDSKNSSKPSSQIDKDESSLIQRAFIDKLTVQLKMDFCLVESRAAVMQLIEQEYGIKLPVRTVGKFLNRWGFTPQKPIKKAYERPEVIKAWLDEHYPAIRPSQSRRR